MTSKLAHPGVRQRARSETFSKRYEPYMLHASWHQTLTCDEQLGETNAALGSITQDSDNPPSQSMLRAIQRHRDVYQDYGREFRRTKVCTFPLYRPVLFCPQLHPRRQMYKLLLIRPTCLAAYATTSSACPLATLQAMSLNYNYCSAYKSSAAEALLAERGRIDSSHQMIDTTLECVLIHLLLSHCVF